MDTVQEVNYAGLMLCDCPKFQGCIYLEHSKHEHPGPHCSFFLTHEHRLLVHFECLHAQLHTRKVTLSLTLLILISLFHSTSVFSFFQQYDVMEATAYYELLTVCSR